MSCCNNKDCDCHQNGSFIFGLLFGLIIGAVIAIIIYKNNKEKVFEDLKKKLEKFFNTFKESETFQNVSTLAKKIDINNSVKIHKKINKKIRPKQPQAAVITKPEIHKKEVTIPKNLIIADNTPKAPTTKPSKMFKK